MTLLGRTAEIAQEYLEGVAERQVAASRSYEELVEALDGPLPATGTDPTQVVEGLAATLGPGTVASAGPRYFGFVVGGSTPAALAADWMVSAWDQTSFSQASSPAGAAVEAVAERWVLEALGLPGTARAGFTTGATAGNLVGLLAARHRVLERVGWDVEARGLTGAPPVSVLVGEEVHPSLLVALRMAGFGEDGAVRVASDDQGAMRADAVADAAGEGDGPAIICAQAGNVNTGACDPLDAIADAADEAGAWLHVDGAFGLWAAASPSLRHLVAGAERADSLSVDAHKWLNVPYDSGIAIVTDPEAAAAAVGTSASYLMTDAGREPFEAVPEMSRRMRAAPIYAALRALGRDGLAELIERCCSHARRLAAAMEGVDGVEVLNEVVLNQVLVRFDDDETTAAVIEAVQRDGTAWVGGTVWHGRAAVRVAVSNHSTTEGDIDLLAESFIRALDAVRSRG